MPNVSGASQIESLNVKEFGLLDHCAAQTAGAAQAAPAAYATGAFGLDSDAHMQALFDLVVAIRTTLVDNGMMKGAA